MNKFHDFVLTQLIIVAFVVAIVLATHTYLVRFFHTQELYLLLIILLIIFGTSVYFVISKTLFKDLQKWMQSIDLEIKQTLHELNTPVATIKANVSLLKKVLQGKDAQRLQRIQKASDDLFVLYQSMEYKIKSKITHSAQEKVDIKQIIEQSISKHKELSQEVFIHVSGESFCVICSHFALQKVIDNLLHNAIKYNTKKDGCIHFVLDTTSVRICDNAKIIESSSLIAIFDPYFQESHTKEGFGMGLFIVKNICDENKIAIKIYPHKNGNCFELDFTKIMSDI